MSKYTDNNHKIILDKLLSVKAGNMLVNDISIDDNMLANVIYAYSLNDAIFNDDKYLRILVNNDMTSKTVLDKLRARIKSKKEILFNLPDYVPNLFHSMTRCHLLKSPITPKDALLNLYN